MYIHIHRQLTTHVPSKLKNYNTCLTLLKKKKTCVIKKKKDLPVKYSIFASFLEIQNYAFKKYTCTQQSQT